MKVAITGAGGLVGNHLARRLAPAHEVFSLKRRDLDITRPEEVRSWCENARPELILNCAVIGVDECERDEGAARAVNVNGPQALAEVAAEIGAEFLHFSSNYVFDGREEGRPPYTIHDEPRPVNLYGATKLAGERAVRAAAPRSYVVRTSWVYGAGKESFLATVQRRLCAGQTVRAITDTRASTTYVADLVGRVLEIVERHHYGTYHVVNEGVCSYEDFAREAARLCGLRAAEAARLIETTTEAEMGRVAARPRYTPLRCLLSEELGLAPLRDWREALAVYTKGNV